MRRRRLKADPKKRADVLAGAGRDMAARAGTYRERALALFPHVCGRCGREFEGKRLRELTVHHRDHDHNNNPPDGSNWELLCLYCHDDEHQDGDHYGGTTREVHSEESLGHNPFAGLKGLVAQEDEDSEPE